MKQIAAFIHKKGWSRAEFGRQVKVDRSTVSRWLSGERRPTVDQLKEIAAVTGISIIKLLQD